MAKKKKKRKSTLEKLTTRNRQLGRISTPGHASNTPGGKTGTWKPGNPIPARTTRKESEYIGMMRHEAALKKYKKKKRRGK